MPSTVKRYKQLSLIRPIVAEESVGYKKKPDSSEFIVIAFLDQHENRPKRVLIWFDKVLNFELNSF